jgi:hypothetical protein
MRAPVIAIAAVVVAAAVVVGGVRALGDITRRPEGAAERFLQSVDRDDARGLTRYGSRSVAQQLFGGTDVAFSHIEVGRGVAVAHLYVVPFRVVLDDSDRVIDMSLVVQRRRNGEWTTTGAAPRGPTSVSRVPSEGGRLPAAAPSAAWIIALLTIAGLTLGAEGVLRALRSDHQVSTT